MAFNRPPSEPGGGVISVNSRSDRLENPRSMVVHKIQNSQNRPKAIAAKASVRAMRLVSLRRAWRFMVAAQVTVPSWRDNCISSSFDSDRTTKVMKNRIRPSSISDAV